MFHCATNKNLLHGFVCFSYSTHQSDNESFHFLFFFVFSFIFQTKLFSAIYYCAFFHCVLSLLQHASIDVGSITLLLTTHTHKCQKKTKGTHTQTSAFTKQIDDFMNQKSISLIFFPLINWHFRSISWSKDVLTFDKCFDASQKIEIKKEKIFSLFKTHELDFGTIQLMKTFLKPAIMNGLATDILCTN